MKWIFVSARLNDIDLIKLKIPSEAELNSIVEGNRTIYEEKIKIDYLAGYITFMI